ncbi:MAG: phytase [Chloroflexota bacterium]
MKQKEPQAYRNWHYLLTALLTLGLLLAGTAVVLAATYSVSATIETTNDDSGEQRRYDDPAIWIHPTDPSLSLVIAANKNMALFTFNLDGTEQQDVDEPNGNDSYNNVDVRYRFPLNGTLVDIAVATQRNTNSLEIYKVDVATRMLVDIGDKTINDALVDYEPYGIGLYHDPATNLFYAFVTDNGGDNDVHQYQLVANPNDTIKLVWKRTFDNVNGLAEGVVADDINGFVYVAEEDDGIYKYDADPAAAITRTTVALVGDNGIDDDIEGLTIYYAISDNCNGKTGYLIASSQGNATFHIFEREAGNAFVGDFSVVDHPTNGIDGLSGTDGIDVTNVALGPNFPNGFFAAHDDIDDTTEFENIKMIDWQDIATGISAVPAEQLCVDISWHPRIVPPTISSSAVSVSNKMEFSWTDDNPTSCYAIYRSTNPYFTADGTTLYDDTLTAAIHAYEDPDANVIGSTANNYFYVVEARNCDSSLPEVSATRVGEFDFSITPGSA